jgi:hypothetical protein
MDRNGYRVTARDLPAVIKYNKMFFTKNDDEFGLFCLINFWASRIEDWNNLPQPNPTPFITSFYKIYDDQHKRLLKNNHQYQLDVDNYLKTEKNFNAVSKLDKMAKSI